MVSHINQLTLCYDFVAAAGGQMTKLEADRSKQKKLQLKKTDEGQRGRRLGGERGVVVDQDDGGGLFRLLPDGLRSGNRPLLSHSRQGPSQSYHPYSQVRNYIKKGTGLEASWC